MEELKEKKRLNPLIKILIFLLLIIGLTIFYSIYFGTKGLEVHEYRIESKILSKDYSGLKIVHISDLKYKSTIYEEELKQIINKINELKPDIVVFTGDLVFTSGNITSQDKQILIDNLSKIEAKINKYAIYGDADYKYKEYQNIMKLSSFKILDNSYDEIYYDTTEPIYIVGLPSSIKEKANYKEAFKFYKDEDRKYIITLVHDGNTIKNLEKKQYETDLILGGHSLGGYANIPGIGPLIKDPKSANYQSGHYQKGITNIFISGGIGVEKHIFRLNNIPSINFYRIKSL